MSPLRVTFARLCRDARSVLDVSQQQLADAVGISRPHMSAIETGRANPSLDVVARIGDVLGLELEFATRQPLVMEPRQQRDVVHARCSGYVDRRLRAAGWTTRREVEVVHGRSHGWIDLLAFDPRTDTLIIVEVKTRIDDLGAIERQLAWYERSALDLARALGWVPRRSVTWLLVLATEEVEAAVRINRDAIRSAFPTRSIEMRMVIAGTSPAGSIRGLALIDPASRRRDWLLSTRSDGRRSDAPYRDYADAARRLTSRRAA